MLLYSSNLGPCLLPLFDGKTPTGSISASVEAGSHWILWIPAGLGRPILSETEQGWERRGKGTQGSP